MRTTMSHSCPWLYHSTGAERGIGKPVLFLARGQVPTSPFPPLALLYPSRRTPILTLTSTENRLLQPGARLM